MNFNARNASPKLLRDNQIALSPRLRKNLIAGNVEVFAIGVGNINFPNLQSLVQDPDKHAFLLENFDQFAELATYVRGGM